MTARLRVDTVSAAVRAQAERWRADRLMTRLWDRDPTVWSDTDVPELTDRLGWLTLPTSSRDLVATIRDLHEDAGRLGITDIVLCGMGGSSLAPEVFAATLPRKSTDPLLTVLDSTHPDAVAAVNAATTPQRTWYIIASKSGTTLETMSFFHWFWVRASDVLQSPGDHFIAITDPGTPLENLAKERIFRKCVPADPTVGGRYSALTAFGLVPAGLVGANTEALLANAASAAVRCGPEVELLENPAFVLGASLATNALQGIDKAHIIAANPVASFPIWVEQLIAESTGKDGKGIVPVDGGPMPSRAKDGTVVPVGAREVPDATLTLLVDDPYDIAGAMFIFELATAIAGEMLGIHPFNQPDVQLAKLLAASAMAGELDDTAPAPLDIDSGDVTGAIRDLLANTTPSYVSVQAYLAPTTGTDEVLEALRSVIDTRCGVYTTAGYGPRFLHSTGQLHKGGPPGGAFIQVMDKPRTELFVPETDFSFNQLITAQAAGDRAALVDRGRDVISIDLGQSTSTGLALLLDATRAALQ
ncbi:MAG: hypothetical protein BMS9Abin20_0253 [Acidimicrobiia bacterium]|nr:MAG: hypothetical protein BMS9Abin20_0253 [Acidimicrobiia bacterium]